MTLATRCPACGTVFRVVQDQLRVSQGWVRCGRCAEAFNALESMVDPPVARVPAAPPAMAAPAVVADHTVVSEPTPVPAWPSAQAPVAADASAAASGLADDTHGPSTDRTALPDAAIPDASTALIELPPGVAFIASDGAVSVPVAPADDDPLRTEPDFDLALPAQPAVGAIGADAAPVAGHMEPVDEPAPVASSPIEPDAGNARLEPAAEDPAVDVKAPSFIVQADRAERWRRPGVRRTLMLVSALSALALAGQGAFVFRDRLAVSAPWMRPALLQACATLGCRVGDFRQIESLSVESSGLQRVDGSPVYRLAVTLRNRAAVDVAAPALDLALTDAQGRQIARRVLQMSDLNLPLRNLKAGSELPIQVPLGINERQVSGYTVEIFYP